MITTAGKPVIKRYLAQQGTLASSIVVGVGSTSENLLDAKLAFETARFPVELVSYDFTNNLLVFKGTMPDNLAGKIYEAGLFTLPVNLEAGGYGSVDISTFDSSTEDWTVGGVPATFGTTVARVGIDSLTLTPALSTTSTAVLAALGLDLSGYSSADRLVFAYNVGNANTSQVVFRFLTDASNYYSFSLGVQTAGYKLVEATKGSATVTGTPSWASITEIDVLVTSGAGGASSVDLDGIRMEDMDTISADYVLLARKVLAAPVTKEFGKAMEFEYSLVVSV